MKIYVKTDTGVYLSFSGLTKDLIEDNLRLNGYNNWEYISQGEYEEYDRQFTRL